jgi:type III secretion protein C
MSMRLSIVSVASMALAFLITPALSLAPKWPLGPYQYLVLDQDLKGVLTEFGRNIDVPVDVSDQVKGQLRGELPAAGAEDFLNKLCESYGLVWYFDGAVLHINAKTEVRTELIDIGRLSSKDVAERLNSLGIADARFPIRTTPDAGVVSVSGPPPYRTLVRQTLAVMARAGSLRPAPTNTAATAAAAPSASPPPPPTNTATAATAPAASPPPPPTNTATVGIVRNMRREEYTVRRSGQ